ncbi:hypothetical protein LTR94_026098, partial [Friedmanniomyces endolithicus]
FDVATSQVVSQNVIARLPGVGHPDETVLYTAHWDHIGMGEPDASGDRIFNGAVDNASGTSGLLELARAYGKAERTDRSVVMISFTAEESGLLGAEYYASNPVYPLAKTVGGFNMDSMNVYGRVTGLGVTGYGQSDFDERLATAAQAQGREIVPDHENAAGTYYRSDHFPLAKRGVPMAYAGSRGDFRDEPIADRTAARSEYGAKRYHQAADEWSADWDYRGMIEDLDIFYSVGRALAEGRDWPEWKSTSEFGPIRAVTRLHPELILRPVVMNLRRSGLAALTASALSALVLAACAGSPVGMPAVDAASLSSSHDEEAFATASATQPDFSAQRLSDHIKYLASDELEGRFPGKIGEELTLAYLQKQYEALGLEPGGRDGGWLQPVELVRFRPERAPTATWTGGDNQSHPLASGQEITLRAGPLDPRVLVEDAPLVFVGYGISAPGWDDYGAADLTGKVAVVLGGQPQSMGADPNFYGSGTHKTQEALKRGAVGVLTLQDQDGRWRRAVAGATRPQMTVRGAKDARFTGAVNLSTMTAWAGSDF